MIAISGNTETSKTTSYRVVLPFYLYAAAAFLVATVLLFISATSITEHYYHPHTLAITHTMALGWGTMIILGAGHQLVPVLIEGKLYSDELAYASFLLAATGIPLLVYGFYFSDMGWPAKWGGQLILLAIISYLINLAMSMAKRKRQNVQALFVFTATIWLAATATIGLMLVYNFSYRFMPENSMAYLPLHAHIGIVGWFLLLIIGVSSRLIPMFLISKYNNPGRLWWIYGLINGGLLAFIFIFLYANSRSLLLFPLSLVTMAIVLFGCYCYKSYRQRIRKKMDEQMKVSLLSVLMMILPVIFVIVIIVLSILSPAENIQLAIAYGFNIFFGWITAIILGMTFKTLPFIVWNKIYHRLAGKGKVPNPKDLFSNRVFQYMAISYISGFILFTVGIFLGYAAILQAGATLLVCTSILYNLNVIKLLMHKPVFV